MAQPKSGEAGRRLQPPDPAHPVGKLLRLPRPRREAAQGEAAAGHQGGRLRRAARRRPRHRARQAGRERADRAASPPTNPTQVMPPPQDRQEADAASRSTLLRKLDRAGRDVVACTGRSSRRSGRRSPDGQGRGLAAQPDRPLHPRPAGDAKACSPRRRPTGSTLLRRVTLDLTGLPPTPAEVDAFLADTVADAYEKVVDRLLQSPRYGEHMARFWLDAARYGDTHGLHLDNYREMWPYRDWVIKAFNRNKPFDRFVIEQLAGDLLPERDARPDRRHRLQPLPRHHQRGRLDRGGGLRPQRRRSRRHHRHGLPRPDGRLRPLPRPQVRPDHAEGVLPALRLLQQPRRQARWTATPPGIRRRQVRRAGGDRSWRRPNAWPAIASAEIAEVKRKMIADAG